MGSYSLSSPSGIVQVEEESFIPKLGKDLIVVSVHIACIRESQTLQEFLETCSDVKVFKYL